MSIKKSFKWKVGYIPSNSKLKERKKYIGTIPATKIKKNPFQYIFFNPFVRRQLSKKIEKIGIE
ncbi:MAG: hypothetical protein WAW84_06905 [Candidatus Rickettsiella isopodorum]